MPGGWDNPLVKAFALSYFRAVGYPEDTKPSSQHWFAVAERDQSEVQVVFGWRVLKELEAISFDDFYARSTRRGVLASYAALERIRLDADRSGNTILTATPVWNTKMLKGMRRFFGAPTFALTVYNPKGAPVIESPEDVARAHIARVKAEIQDAVEEVLV